MLDPRRANPSSPALQPLASAPRAASNRGSWQSRSVCSAPAAAAQSLELRSDGSVTCTLLSSEREGFTVLFYPMSDVYHTIYVD